MGMNELLKIGLTEQQLIETGCKLGADVPFFIIKSAALAEGIGEKLTPLREMPNCWILLVNPGVSVSTAWVYRSLQLTNKGELNKMPKFFESIEQIVSILSNDLETVTIPAFPVIADIKSRLISLGAAGSLMSGSGPTVFGVFTDGESAKRTEKILGQGNRWLVFGAQSL